MLTILLANLNYYNMKTIELTHDLIVHILSGAFTGSYWIDGIDYAESSKQITRNPNDCLEDILAKILEKGLSFDIIDTEDEYYNLTKEKLENGLQIVQEKYPDFYKDFVEENGDYYTYDAILQCALFDDIIFG